jgi:hypothetical protein
LTEIDKVATHINSCLDDVADTCHRLDHIIMVGDKIEKAGGVENLVKNMDYKMVIALCYPDKASYKWIQAMVEAILSDPEVKELIKNGDTLSQDSHNKIFTSIANNPLVDACGHSGGSFNWTYNHARDYIRSTPEKFVNTRFANYLRAS